MLRFILLLVLIVGILLLKSDRVYGSALDQEEQLSDAELGLSELMKTAQNPKNLMAALEMLKDPEIAAEVKAMMQDPQFQTDMKKFTSSPVWKESMEKAKDISDKLNDDPVLLKQFESQLKS